MKISEAPELTNDPRPDATTTTHVGTDAPVCPAERSSAMFFVHRHNAMHPGHTNLAEPSASRRCSAGILPAQSSHRSLSLVILNEVKDLLFHANAKRPGILPGPSLKLRCDYFLWKSSLFAATRLMSSFVYVRAACFIFFASADAATGLAVSARPA